MEPGLYDKSLGSETPPEQGPAVMQQQQESKNYLITIGLDVYKENHVPRLYCCKNDCRQLADVLMEDYKFIPLCWYSEEAAAETGEPMRLMDEKATREKIEELFNSLASHPRFSQDNIQEPDHNLLIYFSGHGTLELNNQQPLFKWIPWNYDGKRFSNTLYPVSRLVEALGNIRCQHLILISDTCHAGGAMPVATKLKPYADTSNVGNKTSCWGIFSSTADENSYGSILSVFTSELIKQLRNDDPCEISVAALFDKLETTMEKSNQHPVSSRLDDAGNTGKFFFTPSKEKIKRNNFGIIQSHLETSITTALNFKKEKNKLFSLDADNHCLTVISTPKDSGLKLLMRSALQVNSFVGYGLKPYFIEEENLDYQGDQPIQDKVLAYFRLALGLNPTNQPMLIQQLTGKLKNTSLFMGLHLFRNTNENCNLVKALLALIQQLPGTTGSGRLYFFILDENETEYNGLAPQPSMLIANPIWLLPKDVEEWHDHQLKQMTGPWAANQRFAPPDLHLPVLFDKEIYRRLFIFKGAPNTGVRPGPTIREICALAACPAWADILLNSFDNLPPKYLS
jgi:hypothetical protein